MKDTGSLLLPVGYNWHFAYGSNMNLDRMRDRIGEGGAAYATRQLGIVWDHALCFDKPAQNKKGVGYATIHPDPGSRVEGVLIALRPEAFDDLDRHEGYPRHYRRKKVQVHPSGGEAVTAVAYVATRPVKTGGLKPTREYLTHLLAGRDVLSAEYLRRLENWPTVD